MSKPYYFLTLKPTVGEGQVDNTEVPGALRVPTFKMTGILTSHGEVEATITAAMPSDEAIKFAEELLILARTIPTPQEQLNQGETE
jgi:hypothetical protein